MQMGTTVVSRLLVPIADFVIECRLQISQSGQVTSKPLYMVCEAAELESDVRNIIECS